MDTSQRSLVCRLSVCLACAAGALLLSAGPVQAQDNYQAPFIEMGLGATNITATAGNGGLTAGISKDGDLTMLSWPSPSYWDQLSYITTNAPDARRRPRLGAPKRSGAFAGVVVKEQADDEPTVSLLRDWERTVTYAQDDVRIVETIFSNDSLGLEVVQRDTIPPDRDVLVRHYTVSETRATSYASVDLLGYTNLAPGMSKVPQIPLLDVLMDHKNDFLAVWDQANDAVLHFHPGDTGIVDTIQGAISAATAELNRDFGPLGTLLEDEQPDESEIATLVSDLDSHYAEGVYAAIGASPAPESFQVGEVESKFCGMLGEIADNIAELQNRFPDRDLPADPAVADLVRCDGYHPTETIRDRKNWSYTSEDAFDDMQDGKLREHRLAGAQANSVVRVPFDSDNGEDREATLYVAFGDTSEAALQTLDWARDEGASAIEQTVTDADEQFVDNLYIPEEVDGKLLKFIKRAFLNLKVGTDAETGAIVASISRQPSYQLDWPRDGAFFNTGLDLSGQHDLVTKRMKFYSDTIRDQAEEPVPFVNTDGPGWPDQPGNPNYPPDSWEMNYYADGVPGGNIRLEIDNTALLVWAYVAHAGHLPENKRSDYIDREWPTIKRAANFVADWRHPETGLMWPANEDDHAAFTQGFQGASTSYLALVSAARLAKHLGEDELADRWLERAGELHAATMHYMADDEYGFRDYNEEGAAAGRAWAAWPTRFLPYDNERLVEMTRSGLNSTLEKVRGERGNFNYPTKIAIGAAIALSEESERDKSLEIAERMATEIANQETWTIGESVVPVDEDDDGTTDDVINGVSTPHLWSSILVYVTTVAYYAPERFDAYRDVFPEVTVPEVTPPGVDAGDGDAGAGDGDAGGDAGDAGPTADAGGDAGGDTGGTTAEPPEDDGCDCTSTGSGPVGGFSLAFAVIVLAALRRRRRR